jgi:hypothetical protein
MANKLQANSHLQANSQTTCLMRQSIASMDSTKTFLRRHYPLLIPLAVYFFILLPFVNFFPIWDAKEYADALYSATHHTFSIWSFGFYGHPSYLYGLLFALTQYWAPNGISIVSINLLSIILGALALVAFQSIVRSLFPAQKPWEFFLMTLIFAVHPVILGNIIYFSPDAGVMFFLLYTIALLLKGNHRAAVWTGIILVFTKEVGSILYAATIVVYFLCYFCRRPELAISSRARLILRRRWLLFPLFLFFVYFIFNRFVRGTSGFWLDFSSTSSFLGQTFLQWDFMHPRFMVALQEMFMINFLWIPASIILIAIVLALWDLVFPGGREKYVPIVNGRGVSFVLALCASSVLLLTRQVPFMNLRYFLSVYPLSLLSFYYCLLFVTRHVEYRLLILITIVLANVVSIQHSIDPVSRYFFPTFAAGGDTMYALGRFDSCCSNGRDQLIYNLEYTSVALLQDRAYAWIRPTKDTIIVEHQDSWQGFNQFISPVTFERVAVQEQGFLPLYRTPEDVLAMQPLPPEIYIFDYPFFVIHDRFADLLAKYDILEDRTFEIRGKSLLVSRLALKDLRDQR